MQVRKPTTSPAETRTHFVCVPGRQSVPSKPGRFASSPAICVSSPRITSGGSACISPATTRTRSRASRTGAVAIPSPRGGQGTGR